MRLYIKTKNRAEAIYYIKIKNIKLSCYIYKNKKSTINIIIRKKNLFVALIHQNQHRTNIENQ